MSESLSLCIASQAVALSVHQDRVLLLLLLLLLLCHLHLLCPLSSPPLTSRPNVQVRPEIVILAFVYKHRIEIRGAIFEQPCLIKRYWYLVCFIHHCTVPQVS